MKITSKGQVTIPQAIREKYGLLPDTEVEFVETDNGSVEIRSKLSPQEDFRQFLESCVGTATGGMTTDEVMQMTRGED